MPGYDVEGIDIDKNAIDSCLNEKRKLNVKINARVGDIANTDIGNDKYSILLATYMWQYFSREQVLMLIEKMKKALHAGGVIYIAVVAANNICFQRIEKDQRFTLVGPNTYFADIEK